MKRSLALSVLVYPLALACHEGAPTGAEREVPSVAGPQFAQMPADGNGNKQVFSLNSTNPVTCPNGEIITRTVEGWVQVRFFDQDGKRNVELNVWHSAFTFTNSAGESFVWHDVGPDRYWLQDGNLMLSLTGRAGGHIGTFTLNLTTGEVVFSAGQDLGLVMDQACAALT